MFGRAPRGVSERPKTVTASRAIPSWLWLIVFVLAGLCVAIFLSLWNPWRPVTTPTPGQPVAKVDQDTNKDYKFYDLLPQQQVTPIPDQAVPEHQNQQPVVVVEAQAAKTSSNSSQVNDPFDESFQAAKIPVPPRYILQVRSYEDPDFADARRAEIVLNGLSAEVIMTNEGNKVWYRVISGPYDSQESARIAQQTLQNGGIDSIIVKQPAS
ncbi:SPOR domain-containing protein [Acinetobacter puyangensis]|uniref:SPOR domain-containing protein n=1 Tax=Acinetobacter puyangensis TaxID=1096779 RepID=UPI003A4D4040